MKDGLVFALFVGFFSVFASSPTHADTTLVSYGSEDHEYARPSDGLTIYENARGFVEPTDEERFSGYRSLELQEAPLDGEFVELQGVVAPLSTGYAHFHFAFFVTNPEEELNIALAGPAHFGMKPDGIALWLQSDKGVLFHHSDAIPKRLFAIEPRSWYVADIVLDIEHGTYDLRFLKQAQQTPVAMLRNQPNAINTPKSRISKLSFIGDLEDRSNVRYFVDDVQFRHLTTKLVLADPSPSAVSGAQRTVPTSPEGQLISGETVSAGAPSTPPLGTLDAQLELQALEFTRPQCLPATSYRDFGVRRQDLVGNVKYRNELRSILDTTTTLSFVPSLGSKGARGAASWRLGCEQLAAGSPRDALRLFNDALALAPEATIIRAAKVVAAHAAGDRATAELELAALYVPWAKDARLPVLIGMLAASLGDHGQTSEALNGVAARLGEEQSVRLISALLAGDASGHDQLKELFGDRWRKELDHLYIGNNYYLALLFSKQFAKAADFAAQMTTRYGSVEKAERFWTEREADARAILGERERARERYKAVVDRCTSCPMTRRKLEDLEFRMKGENIVP